MTTRTTHPADAGRAFTFISSYRGEHDYRRRADGRRYRVRNDDPLRMPTATDGGTIDATVWGEWHAYRIAERAAFIAWCEAKGYDPQPIAAEGWPELVEVHAS
jgi:hypothetical protein